MGKKDKKDKKKKEKKDKKKKDKKKDKKDKKKEKKEKKEIRPVTTAAPASAAAVREQLVKQASRTATPVAVPGNMPDVDNTNKFAAAKANLERLRGAQQEKQKKVDYTVRKPNW